MLFNSRAGASLPKFGLLIMILLLAACGGDNSEPSGAPRILHQPSAVTANVGDTATFMVTASGTAPLSVQWMRGGVDIAGATNLTYVTSALSQSDSGAQFSVRISNSVGQVTSNAVVLTVRPLAEGTLVSGVRILTDDENALVGTVTDTRVTFNGSISLAPGTVVVGASIVFKVVSSGQSGSQTIVTITAPAVNEIFSSLAIKGSFDATPDTATPSASDERAFAKDSKRPLDQIGTTETFNWPFTISDGGFTLNSTLTSKLSVTVDYEFDAADGLQKSSLDVSSFNTLDIDASYALNASTQVEKNLGQVTIPISVSIIDVALRAIGVRVVSISIPVYAGARAQAAFQLEAGATVEVDGDVRIDYASDTGAVSSSKFTGSETVGSLTPATPGGAATYATDIITAGIYVRLAPALTFLNTVALLGVDTSISLDGTELLEITPGTPPYCVTSNAPVRDT